MRNILLIGAGKSSSHLIRFFSGHAAGENWHLTVGDLSADVAAEKAQGLPGVTGIGLDIANEAQLKEAIGKSSLVISLLPAHLHTNVAKLCVAQGVHMTTASYVSPEMKALTELAAAKGVILLNECGLDPGLDHMSAMEVLDRLRS